MSKRAIQPTRYRVALLAASPARSSGYHVELIDKGDGVPVLWIGDVHENHVAQLVGGDLLHAIARAVVENVPEPRAPRRPRPQARRGKR